LSIMPKHVIRTSINISADPKKIWDVLNDFDRYPEWNPFLLSIVGEKSIGSKLTINIDPKYFMSERFKARLDDYSEGEEIRWRGRFWIPHMFAGDHSFKIIPNTSGVTFIQQEEFSGILVPLLKKMLNERTKKGYEEMNRALKARSEKG
jgi:hypothetical protein